MIRKLVRIILIAITGVVVTGVCALLFAQQMNDPATSIPDSGAVFSVAPGEVLFTIAERLHDEGFVKSALFLKLLSYGKGTQAGFQAGTYRIVPGMTTLQIHNLLVSGREIMVRVTIPEGWSASHIASRLESLNITGRERFLEEVANLDILSEYDIAASSAEGYLFPDTYLFPVSYPAESVVRVLIERFFQRVDSLLAGGVKPDAKTFHDVVILASIIEREYRDPGEARTMASVFYNRLESDMKLQSCATVAYVLTEELGREYPEVLTFDDLEIESDYNTYWSFGLPPGPIANPGLTAIDAALNPAQSDYLFFVLKDTDAGKHEFSRSFDEHLTAKNLYLKKS